LRLRNCRANGHVLAGRRHVFNPAGERAGLDPALTFHGLCHVAASLMVEQGEHPRVIQGRLGHVAGTTLARLGPPKSKGPAQKEEE
jgi:site-specific recombinase XerD